MNNIEPDFSKLIRIVDELREKCAWDKKQTINTLRQQTIEETFELADAITDENWKGIKEELGDLLLHIVFYSRIGSEKEQFTLREVVSDICEKLIRRHPHIYAKVDADTEEKVKQNWEQIKLKEGKTSVLAGVPRSLPAMVKAMRVQDKVKQVGFEWANKEQVWLKVKEEESELLEAVQLNDPDKMEDELGDLLFSIINYSRFIKIDAEQALERTNKKFIKRFSAMEKIAGEKGHNLQQLSLDDMEVIWQQVKQTENK